MKFGQGPTLAAKFLKENEVKGSSREELEIILLMVDGIEREGERDGREKERGKNA